MTLIEQSWIRESGLNIIIKNILLLYIISTRTRRAAEGVGGGGVTRIGVN